MEFEPRHYFLAALERYDQSRALYRRGEDDPTTLHSLGVYATGLAVECMLRAFVTRATREFDSRHIIAHLYEKSHMWVLSEGAARRSGLSEAELDRIKRELDGAIAIVDRLWRNEYRFATWKKIDTNYYERGFGGRIRGDIVKENYRRLLHAAEIVIRRGTLLWDAATVSPRG